MFSQPYFLVLYKEISPVQEFRFEFLLTFCKQLTTYLFLWIKEKCEPLIIKYLLSIIQ